MATDDQTTVQQTEPEAAPRRDADHLQIPGGRYRILGEIAHGGMGIVLRAHDASFDRPLAIKLMRPRREAAGQNDWRFLEEAAITGQLQHPGIPPVHEIGRLADGRPYFCMKLIEGRTLANLLEARPSAGDDLAGYLKIFEQVAQTLAYAHAQGIIHRDLKPLNIMVGAFGEVQVMDWGLAKRLRHDSSSGAGVEPRTAQTPDMPPLDETVAADIDTRDSHTQAGVVLGTLAYMAPEQARGAIDELDERCDVFGLGAILCVILTGRPPYVAGDRQAVWQLAREADIAAAWRRLDNCAADFELVQLTRSCLAPDKEDRPRDAGQVASAMSRYLAALQQRLQDARVARGAAEVQAREERKRRRLVVGLAAALLLLIGGTAAVGVWRIAERERRQAESLARQTHLEREVSAALDEAALLLGDLHSGLNDREESARLLSELGEWRDKLTTAQERWNRADRLAAADRGLLNPGLSARLAETQVRLSRDHADWRLAHDLDTIRQRALGIEKGAVELARAVPDVERTLREAGFDVRDGDTAGIADRMRASNSRPALVAGLDFWALIDGDPAMRTKVFEVARLVDPDPWRDLFRRPDAWDDAGRLQALAAEADLDGQSPQLIAALAMRLRLMKCRNEAVALLRRGLLRHPRDFWLLSELGYSSHNLNEQEGAFRGAVGVRPDSAFAWYNLGFVLYRQQAWALAGECFQRAIDIDPTYVGAYIDLGLSLDALRRPAEAIEQFRRAIALEPDDALAHLNLGGALQGQGKWDEALAEYRRAMVLKPDLSAAHNNTGAVLREMGRLDEAVAMFEATVERFPGNALAWCNLGHALTQQGHFVEALPAFETGHKLSENEHAWSYPSAQWIDEAKRRIVLDEKLSAALRGEATLETDDPREQLELANFCLLHRRRYAAAADYFAAAFAADPQAAHDPAAGLRYNAACAAALAAAGAGEDAAQLSDERRGVLRGMALEWLRAELAAWSAAFGQESPPSANAARTLRHWQVDPDLASLRDADAVGTLSAEQQAAWRQFWQDVAAQLAAIESEPR